MTVQRSSPEIDRTLLPTPPSALMEEPSEDLCRLGETLKARAEALALASTCVDLRVTQVANVTWGVHALLPAGLLY